jgi:hypothetical protein
MRTKAHETHEFSAVKEGAQSNSVYVKARQSHVMSLFGKPTRNVHVATD